jgi:AsmA protein
VRLIFSILTAIILLAAAVVFVGPLFISAEDVRNQLFAQVESATGYRLRVSGPLDVTFFPSLELVAEDVGVAQPATGSKTEFATAKTLKFGLMLQGLLDGKMRMTHVTLVDPVIAVPKKTAAAIPPGQKDQVAELLESEGAQADTKGRTDGVASVAEKLKNLTLDKLVIKNGTVILPPSGGSAGKRIEKLNLEASLPAYSEPLSFDVAAVVDGKAMQTTGSIGNFGHFLEGAPAPVRLTANAPGTLDAPASLSATATYKDDTLTLNPLSAKSGDKTVAGSAVYKDDTVALNQFTATMGRDTFAGNAVYKDNTVSLSSLRANVRGTVLAGSVTANLANKVPYVVAAVAAKTLDVNALTGAPKSKPGAGGGGGGGGSGANAPWSNAPIDFSLLRQIDGKFSVSAEQLVYNQIKISPVTVQATLNGGKLNATLSKFNLYGGAGSAAVAVDASGKTPAQRVQLSLAKFDAYSFLKDAAGFQNLEGKGTVSLDLSGSGASQRAIVSALNGNANLEFANGAIRGVNIAGMIRNLGSGIVEGWQGGTQEKTDFASLGASFKVAKGNATTRDLHLVGPLVRMTGTGTVNLPSKRVNFKVDPQLVASLEGQGGQKDLSGLGVPIMIVGPWSKPKFYPDIKGILQNPQAAIQQFKQFGKDASKLPGVDKAGAFKGVVKDGKVNKDALMEGIGGLLGGTQTQTQPQGAAATPQATPQQPQTQQPQTQSQQQAQTPQAKKAAKKKKKKDKNDAQDAAKDLLNNLLGAQ